MGLQTVVLSSAIMLSLVMMVLLSCLPIGLCSYNDEDGQQSHSSPPPFETTSHLKNESVTARRHLASCSNVVTVTDYGAKGDGKSDDTKAFERAWKKACSIKNGVLEVPRNKKFLLGPITFSGPCKSSFTMKIYGTILASADRSDYKKDLRHWIIFDSISNFHVHGGGTFDGNGEIWWKNSCKIDKSKPCKHAPTAVTFYECKNLQVDTLVFKNAQQMTVSFQKCVGVWGSSLVIDSPGWSPNTDGIHITSSQNVQLSKCSIKTGDDCISIESGSRYIKASDIVCGPGHGISIGSLGDHSSVGRVSDVLVNRAKLTGTTNGVRIKTWQGGSGYARKIRFEDIVMVNVTNPIIIDQNYCDQDEPCKHQSKAVQVENVVYSNIKGTSASEKAVSIECSKKLPCRGLVLEDIDLKMNDGDEAEGRCENARVYFKGRVSPKCRN
uniref:endo-polygalacturonase n=1 Tax=Kalanchoe fedtschenkoi TaxID=63787 RepID=A0A7N0TK36_KALFE